MTSILWYTLVRTTVFRDHYLNLPLCVLMMFYYFYLCVISSSSLTPHSSSSFIYIYVHFIYESIINILTLLLVMCWNFCTVELRHESNKWIGLSKFGVRFTGLLYYRLICVWQHSMYINLKKEMTIQSSVIEIKVYIDKLFAPITFILTRTFELISKVTEKSQSHTG